MSPNLFCEKLFSVSKFTEASVFVLVLQRSWDHRLEFLHRFSQVLVEYSKKTHTGRLCDHLWVHGRDEMMDFGYPRRAHLERVRVHGVIFKYILQ